MLRIQLLGHMAVECDGAELPRPARGAPGRCWPTWRSRPGPSPRGELAAHFWPDVLDSSARASLRSAVWSLRRALGPAAERYLIVDRNCVGLAPGPGAVGGRAPPSRTLVAGRSRARGRRALHGRAARGLRGGVGADRPRRPPRAAARGARAAGRAPARRTATSSEALEWSRRAVAVDPLSEDAHRGLIARLAAAGDRARALMVYRALAERLRRELSVAPSPPRASWWSACASTRRPSARRPARGARVAPGRGVEPPALEPTARRRRGAESCAARLDPCAAADRSHARARRVCSRSGRRRERERGRGERQRRGRHRQDAARE